jgi:hypothetical protein
MRRRMLLLALSLGPSVLGAGAMDGYVKFETFGQKIDPDGVRASVRVTIEESGSVERRLESAEYTGAFHIADLRPGVYTLHASLAGFKSESAHKILVEDGKTAQAPNLYLSVIGCDYPGVNCDCFFDCKPDPVRASGHVGLKQGCAANLESGAISCGAKIETDSDVVLDADAWGRVSLTPMGTAKVSGTEKCARYSSQPLQIDGFGPWDGFCVRTNKGGLSRVFLKEEVRRGEAEVTLWYTTRPN